MSDILEQINSLTEQFSNLFEVEGLGDPASDTPPSTNKIKKDRKTKDGKVELVSVEDELFPYDGNKREQYRQKIIDTINNMIQGTATLEDLLQIVRQKKAPLKEAMELMEDLFSTILKQPEEKQGSLVYKYYQAKNKENAGKDTYTQAKEEEKRKSKEEKGQEKTEQRKLYKGKTKEDWKQGRLMDQIARKAKSLGKVSDPAVTKSIERNQMKKWKSEGFEGAIEILEFLTKNHSDEENPVVKITDKNYKSVSGKHLGGSFNKNQIGNYLVYNKDTDSSYLVTPDNWKKSKIKKDLEAQGKFYEAVEILEEIINEVSDKTAQGALDKAKERYNRKGYEASMKLFQGDSKGAIEDGNKAQDEYNKHINMQLRRAKRQGKKLVQDKNDHDSFKIEEAQELLEEIINEVSLKKWKESAKNSYDKRKEIADKSAEADKKSWDNYEKQSKLSPEDEPELFKKAVDQGAIAYKDKKRADHAMGVYANTPDSKHSATKYNKAILNSLKGREDKYVETGKKSDLDRAINSFHLAKLNPVKEARDLEDTVIKAYKDGKISGEKMGELIKKAHDIPSDASYFHKSKGEKGEWVTKRRHMDYARNTLADDWGKNDDEKVEASIKRKAKSDKSFPVFQALKAYKDKKITSESFDGAIEILEEVINEVSERTKIDAYKKRVAQHQELADRETKIANDYAKLGAYEPAINHLKKASDSQKKEFKHRLNTISHDKKFGQDAFNKAQKELYNEWKAKNNVKEAQELSELFDRPDLLDDISMALTNKTIKQHLENQAKKLLGGKKKIKKDIKENFDSLEENRYNIIKILEEIVNEVSNGKIKDSVTDKENLIDGAKELENLIRTDADKKLIKDAINRDQHRVEVVKDKLENRIVNKARAEYEEGKKKKKKEGE